MEQKYILKNTESFELPHIFECGQCFRWNIEENRKLYRNHRKQRNKCSQRRWQHNLHRNK